MVAKSRHDLEKGARPRKAKIICALAFSFFVLVLVNPYIDAYAQKTTDTVELKRLADVFKARLDSRRTQLYYNLLASTDPATRALNEDPSVQLMFIRETGMPAYYGIHNLNAARTISTDEVWPGGSTGYNLTGNGTGGNEFAMWDAGGVRTSHQEFGGRATQQDTAGTAGVFHFHSTHVAGTLAAAGVNPNAQGMSYQADLDAYDWDLDETEMSNAAAAGLQVSNHSYGFLTGWENRPNGPAGAGWYWMGDRSVDGDEDYGFGFYNSDTQAWDQIAFNAPNYLIVKSAGNDRDDGGPDGAGGGQHFHWDGGWVLANDTHDVDGAPNGYDCIGWKGNAKNILTVGACQDIPGGYTQPADVVLAGFSSWGPTDDGRIKPDIVANGVNLFSTWHTGDMNYNSIGGTSMSTPNVAGSINLLIGHYENVKGGQPLASTMKALVIHTADEAGPADGPDYMNGWGLMNTETAADVISAAPTLAGMIEATLNQGATHTYDFTVSGTTDAQVTIVWLDPPGTPPAAALDPTTAMLVNDLDIRTEHLSSSTTYDPWVLDGANPANAATTGDNSLDNVEKIDITNAQPGVYRITVSHKGTLQGGSQVYSLIWSIDNQPPMAEAGPDQTVECTSPTTTAVTLDGTGSSDPDGDPLTYSWSAPGVVFNDPASPTPTGQFPKGTTTVTLTVSDGEVEDTDTVEITVVDTTPPDLTCPGNITVECADTCGTPADDPQLIPFFDAVLAADDCCDDVDITNDAPACFPLGTTLVTFTATDCDENDSTCVAEVTVEDTTPPEITVELNRDVLWPPNHKMVDISATVVVTDICCPNPTARLDTIMSNEPDNSRGDGNTTADIQGATFGTPDTLFQLRSERRGGGDGRVYTIIYTASDCVNNEASDTAYVRVPHDQSGEALASIGFSADGSGLDETFSCFAVVIPSEERFDATALNPHHVYIGNTAGVLRPERVVEADVNGDALKDLGLYYSTEGALNLIRLSADSDLDLQKTKKSRPHGPIGIHYRYGNDTDYLVKNIFLLGQPVGLKQEPRIREWDEHELVNELPEKTALESIFPNPFNPVTMISFTLAADENVTLRIYNVRGELVRTLISTRMSRGVHKVKWDGMDEYRRPVSTGVYFVRLVAGDHRVTRKAVLLK